MPRDLALVASLALLLLVGGVAGFVVASGDEPETALLASAADEEDGEDAYALERPEAARTVSRRARPAVADARDRDRADAGSPGAEAAVVPVLAGIVRDAAGEPVAGAELRLAIETSGTPGASRPGAEIDRVVSDETGAFVFEHGETDVPVVLTVVHPEHAESRRGPLELAPGHTLRTDVVLHAGSTLRGHVRDEAGRPVAGARIAVIDAARRGEDAIQEGVTDLEGAFAIARVPDGVKRVWASAEGRASAGVAGLRVHDAAPPRPLELVLAPGRPVAGRVVDEAGRGVPFATVSALRRREPGETGAIPPLPEITCDAHGAFRIAGLAEGLWTLRADRDGYDGTRAVAEARPGDTDVTLALSERPSLKGRVVDAETGAPIDAFRLIVSAAEELRHEPGNALVAVRDPEGRFAIPAPPRAGRAYVFARAGGYALGRSDAIPLDQRLDATGIVIRLHRGGSARGRVVDGQGRPVADAAVELVGGGPGAAAGGPVLAGKLRRSGVRGRSLDDGTFLLENVPAGAWTLRIVHPGYCALTAERPVATDGKATADLGEHRLDPGATIVGRCSPAERGTTRSVALVPADGAPETPRRVRPEPDGSFRFERVPAGVWRLALEEGAAGALTRRALAEREVRAVSGAELRVDL